MKTKQIIILLFLLYLKTSIYSQEKFSIIKISNNLIDYQWAHYSNKLAILSNIDNTHYINILNADLNVISDTYILPPSYHFNCLAWTQNDTGFILGAVDNLSYDTDTDTKNTTYRSDNFYCYNISLKNLFPIYSDVERYLSGIYDIVIDPLSKNWAVTYVGEGHPDIAIYCDTKLLLYTDVYPNCITSLKWENKKLYCSTGAYLEYGLTREIRKKNKNFTSNLYEGRDKGLIYEINPENKKAKLLYKSETEIINTSFDDKYYLKFLTTQEENIIKIRFMKK